jgi:hypothetical protein
MRGTDSDVKMWVILSDIANIVRDGYDGFERNWACLKLKGGIH